VPKHRLSTPIHFKESAKDIPVFRRAMQNDEGVWITDPRRALQYSKVAEYEKSTSGSAGYKEKGTLYKYRKGAAANLSTDARGSVFYPAMLTNLFCIGHLDEHSRNAIMGHRRSGTFAYYVSVRDDTQSAFMETPARDALLKLACNSSLTRDASAPQHLPEQEKECIEMNPELSKLKLECNAFRHELIAEYHQLTKARKADPARYDQYRRLQNQVRAKRKKLHTDAKDKMYDNFFVQLEIILSIKTTKAFPWKLSQTHHTYSRNERFSRTLNSKTEMWILSTMQNWWKTAFGH
jgi:hypothetical protein